MAMPPLAASHAMAQPPNTCQPNANAPNDQIPKLNPPKESNPTAQPPKDNNPIGNAPMLTGAIARVPKANNKPTAFSPEAIRGEKPENARAELAVKTPDVLNHVI